MTVQRAVRDLQLRLRRRPGRSALLIANIATEHGGFGLTDQLANVAPLAIAALASAPSIIGGGFDLSISPLIVLDERRLRRLAGPARARRRRLGPDHAGLGLAVGLLNGLLIVVLRVQPIVVTLAMYFILQGVDLLIAPEPGVDDQQPDGSSTWPARSGRSPAACSRSGSRC